MAWPDDVHIGPIGREPTDWRKIPRDPADDLDDDERIVPTPPEIVKLLGFDPAELDNEEDEEDDS